MSSVSPAVIQISRTNSAKGSKGLDSVNSFGSEGGSSSVRFILVNWFGMTRTFSVAVCTLYIHFRFISSCIHNMKRGGALLRTSEVFHVL